MGDKSVCLKAEVLTFSVTNKKMPPTELEARGKVKIS